MGTPNAALANFAASISSLVRRLRFGFLSSISTLPCTDDEDEDVAEETVVDPKVLDDNAT